MVLGKIYMGIVTFITVLLALFAPTLTFALDNNRAETLILTVEQGKYPLGLHLEILEDPSGQLTIEQVSSSAYDEQFIPSQVEVPNFGFTNSAYWLRFRVKDNTPQPKSWRLEMAHPVMQQVSFYLPRIDGTGFRSQNTGFTKPFQSREIAYQTFVFKLPLRPEAEQTFYLRFDSGGESMTLPLTIWSFEEFAQKSQTEQLAAGLFFGALLIMIGYNTFLFLSLREKGYFYYVLFVTCLFCHELLFRGFVSQYLGSDWNPLIVSFCLTLTLIFALKFTSTFLGTKTRVPKLHKFITFLLVIWGLLTIFILFISSRIAHTVFELLTIVSLLTLFLAAFTTWRQGYKEARYFFLAWMMLLVTGFIATSVRLDLLPSNILTEYGYQFGAILLVLLLSLALADRINIFKTEKEKAQTEALNASQENERLIREQATVLEKQVAERTRELEIAREKAESANQAKSTFLANMSHELRSPLNAILGFAQIMTRSRKLAPEDQENLGIISRSGEHLLTLINQVLDLSKIEANRTTLNESHFDLYRLLDDIEDMFRLKADDKSLQLIFDREPKVPQYLLADELKLRQVLINLLNNALKFTEEGGVFVQIRKIRNPEPPVNLVSKRPSLQFEIEDTGPGIAPNELDKLFEAFVQTRTGKQASEGTGLGLAISRQFVQLMGGDMTVSSEVGRGTTFKFSLQYQLAEATDIQKPKSAKPVVALEPNQPRYRILIVDDKWTNRQLLIKLLNPLGFELREAENGQQAVEIWESWQPHLIWMDMRMPVMDGYQATQLIKAHLKGQATAIIALTASVLEEERAVVLDAGCDDFLRKPFKEADIFELMHKHIGVWYIYGDATEPVYDEAAAQEVLTPEALAALPDELLTQLHQVALDLDIELTQAVISQVQNEPLANALLQLAKQFQYSRLLELIEQAQASRSS
jgi:signal transduction histidine kinase/CheY-like chemotaxis protein